MIACTLTTTGLFSPYSRPLRFMSFLIVFLVCIKAGSLCPATADTPDKQSLEQTGKQDAVLHTELDEAGLKASIAHRIRATRGAKDDRYKGFGPDLVHIDEKIAVTILGMAFFAVKIELHAPVTGAVEEVITLIVDKTGTLQISAVHDLASGTNLMQAAVNQLQHVDIRDLPPDFGKEIFTGPGIHKIIAVSDPFCPHCRKGWEFVKLNQDRLKTFRLSSFPLNPAAETACMVMADAHHRQFKVFDIVDFAYTQLQPAPEPLDILVQYMEAFPELGQKWGQDPASALAYLTQTYGTTVRQERNAAQALGINSTPVFFVNDVFIRGFHTQKLEKAMP